MNTRRRLALVLIGLPLAFYAYACSSDSGGGGGTTDDAGGGEPEAGPGVDGSMGTDGSMPGTDGSMGTDAADASDGAVPVVCIGNPLTADGGTPDGGVDLDAAVTTAIVTVPGNIFLDGPQWLDTNGGFLVFSQYLPTAQLERVAADGGAHGLFRDAGFSGNNGPLGSGLRNGQLITAVDHRNASGTPGLFITASDGGAAGTLSLGDAGSNSPNDLVVGPNNNLYFTDGQYQAFGPPGTTGVYRMYPDAAVALVQPNFPGRANGIALSPDNTKLYVGIGPTNAGEDPRAVLVYAVDAAGGLTSPGASFLTATDLADVPDGMAVDVGGNLWIAEAALDGSAKGRIEVFSSTKKKLGTIPFPTQRPTGVTFGGPDGKKLFVTTESSSTGGSAGVFTYVSRCAGIK
jgi:sugar lactone lactonase YvrE